MKTYQIQITSQDSFLHAYVTGMESLENFIAYWREIADACLQCKFNKVLVEDYLQRAVSIVDVHTFATTFLKETGIPEGTKIALVMPREQLDVMMFTENVISNRNGIIIKTFIPRDINVATEWLLK